jgi:hypothetical protein
MHVMTMTECESCDGSGVLEIMADNVGDGWRDRPYMSACHCAMGRTWSLCGLE